MSTIGVIVILTLCVAAIGYLLYDEWKFKKENDEWDEHHGGNS